MPIAVSRQSATLSYRNPSAVLCRRIGLTRKQVYELRIVRDVARDAHAMRCATSRQRHRRVAASRRLGRIDEFVLRRAQPQRPGARLRLF